MAGFRRVRRLRAYSGGTVSDLHRFPYYPPKTDGFKGHLNAQFICL